MQWGVVPIVESDMRKAYLGASLPARSWIGRKGVSQLMPFFVVKMAVYQDTGHTKADNEFNEKKSHLSNH